MSAGIFVIECAMLMLSTEDQWSQRMDGEDMNGAPCSVLNSRCTRRSLIGALRYGVQSARDYEEFSDTEVDEAAVLIRRLMYAQIARMRRDLANAHGMLRSFNNSQWTKFEDVQKLLLFVRSDLSAFVDAPCMSFDHTTQQVTM